MAQDGIEFRILGPFEVMIADRPALIGSTKQRLVLAQLVVEVNRPVPADRLAAELWPSDLPPSVDTTLRSLVTRLRRLLAQGGQPDAGPRIRRGDWGYVLEADPASVDAHRFEALVGAGRDALDAGDTAEAARRFAAGLDLWRGPALADLADAEFARVEAARLDEARLSACEALADAELSGGHPQRAQAVLEPIVARHPLREGAWARLMLALYRTGRQAEALQAYQRIRRLLADEIGLEPGADLRRLDHQILTQSPDLDGPGGQSSAVPSAPRGSVAAPRAVDRPDVPGDFTEPAPEARLPSSLTPFLGRLRELDELATLLDTARLVTLTGVGGVGKTRLAIEAARRRLPLHPDGVWLVELAPVRIPTAVSEIVAGTLGLLTTLGGRDAPSDRLRDWLAARRLLLVLDNCEHVAEGVVSLLEDVLPDAPGVSVLATSREVLGIAGEVTWGVPPLSLPPPAPASAAEVSGSDAVELFCQRARSAQPAFGLSDANATAVAQICHRLDGIPLALELAAARIRMLGAQQLAERLADRFRLLSGTARGGLARHQTLRAAMDWSWDLLTEPERRALRRLSVFPADFSLEAAEAVVSDDGLAEPGFARFDLVARLVDKSLVIATAEQSRVRYHLLETVRSYAAERLAEAGEEDTAGEAHCAWCLGWADRAQVERYWPSEGTLEQTATEDRSFLRATEWCLSRGRREDALRLMALFWLCAVWDDRIDVGGLLTRCVAEPRPAPSAALAECLAATAFFTRGPIGSRDDLKCMLQEACDVAEGVGDPDVLARTRFFVGALLVELGHLDAGREMLLAARDHFVASDFVYARCWCDHHLGWEAMVRNEPVEARAYFEQALGDVGGDLETGTRDALDIYLGVHLTAAIAAAAAATSDRNIAWRMAEHTVRATRQLRFRGFLVMALCRATEVALLLDDENAARDALRELLGLLRALGARRWVAASLESLVALEPIRDFNQGVVAARLLGAARGIRKALGEAACPIAPVAERLISRQGEIASLLPDVRIAQETERGRRASADEALRWALTALALKRADQAASEMA